MRHRTVCIESPLKGTTPEEQARNIAYAKQCMLYVLDQGCSPYASHLLLTQVWDDANPEQREAGIACGLSMGNQCDERWIFTDFGISEGMQRAIEASTTSYDPQYPREQQAIRFVRLGDEVLAKLAPTPTEGI